MSILEILDFGNHGIPFRIRLHKERTAPNATAERGISGYPLLNSHQAAAISQLAADRNLVEGRALSNIQFCLTLLPPLEGSIFFAERKHDPQLWQQLAYNTEGNFQQDQYSAGFTYEIPISSGGSSLLRHILFSGVHGRLVASSSNQIKTKTQIRHYNSLYAVIGEGEIGGELTQLTASAFAEAKAVRLGVISRTTSLLEIYNCGVAFANLQAAIRCEDYPIPMPDRGFITWAANLAYDEVNKSLQLDNRAQSVLAFGFDESQFNQHFN